MDAEIRGETGLLALAGLFWLQEGINTIGSSPDCSICLPKPLPRLLGAFEFDGTRVKFHVDIGQKAEIDGASVQSVAPLQFDDEVGAGLLRSGDFAWAVTRHAGRVGVRVWNSARARAFPPRSWFDIDPAFLVKGNYTGYPAPVKTKFPDSLGQNQDGYLQGYVSFRLQGKSFNLDAAETEDSRLFLQFGDLTNGSQTYFGGRYLYTDPVAENGDVLVDFNKAYNPPSAFTDFAACILAPKDNTVNYPVQAGERYESRPSTQT